MKLLSFRHQGRDTFGAVVGNGVIDLGAHLAKDGVRTLREALMQHEDLADFVRGAPSDARLDEITFLPVITNPDKIHCLAHQFVVIFVAAASPKNSAIAG